MTRALRLWERLCRHPLPVFLLFQGGLLFFRLDLLPIWGDEQFTLDVIRRPWSEITSLLQADIHPPVYYFLARVWIQLPWPLPLIDQVRMLSAVMALLSTALVYHLWLKDSEWNRKVWFLALWSLSPTLLLYSRMARSYSLQLLLSSWALYLAYTFFKEPRNARRMAAYTAVACLLLYTHYLPGLAVILATSLLIAAKAWRERSRLLIQPLLLSHLILVILYLPWLKTLLHGLSRVSQSEPYFLVQNLALETLVKLAYWFTSFAFGESLPVWAIFLGLILGPGIAWLLWHGSRPLPEWLPLIWLVAAAAYAGAAAWVAFPFMGARLLFLLPFYLLWLLEGKERKPLAGRVILGGVLLVSVGSVSSYFQKSGFLNQGYLVPFEDIADYIEQHSSGGEVLVLLDGYNTDPVTLQAALADKLPRIKIRDRQSEGLARERIRDTQLDTVWFLRNTHDISPGGSLSRLEAELEEVYQARRHLYVPYSAADRFAARLLGWQGPPTHHYQMLEFRRRMMEPSVGKSGGWR